MLIPRRAVLKGSSKESQMIRAWTSRLLKIEATYILFVVHQNVRSGHTGCTLDATAFLIVSILVLLALHFWSYDVQGHFRDGGIWSRRFTAQRISTSDHVSGISNKEVFEKAGQLPSSAILMTKQEKLYTTIAALPCVSLLRTLTCVHKFIDDHRI